MSTDSHALFVYKWKLEKYGQYVQGTMITFLTHFRI